MAPLWVFTPPVASSMAGFQCIPGNGISLAIITVVGQCVGADRYDEARYYVKKLFKYSYLILFGLNLIMFAAYPLILGLYNLQSETEAVAWNLCIAHGIGACTLWAMSFCPAGGGRRALHHDRLCRVHVGLSDHALYGLQLFHGSRHIRRLDRHVRGLGLPFYMLHMAVSLQPLAGKKRNRIGRLLFQWNHENIS